MKIKSNALSCRLAFNYVPANKNRPKYPKRRFRKVVKFEFENYGKIVVMVALYKLMNNGSSFHRKKTIQSAEMRQSECRQGDVTPSRDCQTFFFCDQGQFRKAKCEDANGHWSSK